MIDIRVLANCHVKDTVDGLRAPASASTAITCVGTQYAAVTMMNVSSTMHTVFLFSCLSVIYGLLTVASQNDWGPLDILILGGPLP